MSFYCPGMQTGRMWDGMLPRQAPLHAYSDYFDGIALDPKWAEWDVLGNTTVDGTVDGQVSVTQVTHGGASFAGIYQTIPLPDSQFAVTAYYALQERMINTPDIGIFVGEDMATLPNTGNFTYAGISTASVNGPRFTSQGFTSYNVGGAIFVGEAAYGAPLAGFFRVFVDIDWTALPNPTVSFTSLWSLTGHRCCQMNTNTGTIAAYMPDWAGSGNASIGICLNNGGTGLDATAVSKMFRYDATADMHFPVGNSIR